MKETIDSLNPQMIVLGRESRGISQSSLAKKLGVSQGKLSKIENGLLSLSDEETKNLTKILAYPISFFSRSDKIYGVSLSEYFHRKRQSVSQKELNKVYARLELRRIEITTLLKSVDIEESNFFAIDPDKNNGDIEKIAQSVRAAWALPSGPIDNVVNVIEESGGIIIPFDFGEANIDAISNWHPGLPPIIYVNYNRPMDRIRFTLCHEIGHLIMHKKPPSNLDDIENQADRFAAEFLMPKNDISSSLNKLTLHKAAALKPFWKVSMGAILKRAADLNKITERQTRYLWTQMSKAGYRTQEPQELELPSEKPRILDEIINVHQGELQYSFPDLSSALNLNTEEFRRLYLHTKPTLHLVK